MSYKVQTRRAVRAAAALVVLTSAAMIVPPLVLSEHKNLPATTSVQAASRDSITLSEPMTISSSPLIVVRSGTLSVLRDVSTKGLSSTLLDYIAGRRAALALDAAEVDIDLKSAGASDGATAGSQTTLSGEILSAVLKAISSLEFRSLSLKDVALTVHLDTGRTERVTLQSAEFELAKSGDRIFTGALIYKGEPATFDLAVGPPLTNGSAAAAKSVSSEAPKPIRATIKSKYIEGHFDGRLAMGDRAYITANSATVSISNLRKTARWLGESWPDGQGLASFTAKGGLILDTRSIEFQNARFTLDGNSASGTLALRLAGERPSIEGTLAFDAFNVGPYTAAKKQTPIAIVADWLSDLRLPGVPKPALATEIDADLRLSAKSIVSNAQILGRTAASLSIKGGVLSAELAELELEQGGAGTGELAIDMRGSEPHFTLRGELRNVDLERALDNRVIASPLQGQGNVMVDLSGTGSREDQLRASLSGKVSVEMLDGGTLGLDVAALPAVAAPGATGQTPTATWARLGEGTTRLDKFMASFAGRDGVFTTDAFEASSGDLAIVALGSVGVIDGTIDMTVKMLPAGAPEAPLTTGSLPGDTKSAVVVTPATAAYRVRGPWASPAVSTVTNPGKSAGGASSPLPIPSKTRG